MKPIIMHENVSIGTHIHPCIHHRQSTTASQSMSVMISPLQSPLFPIPGLSVLGEQMALHVTDRVPEGAVLQPVRLPTIMIWCGNRRCIKLLPSSFIFHRPHGQPALILLEYELALTYAPTSRGTGPQFHHPRVILGLPLGHLLGQSLSKQGTMMPIQAISPSHAIPRNNRLSFPAYPHTRHNHPDKELYRLRYR